MSEAAARNHNLPDLAATLAPEAVEALIAIEIAPLKERADALLGMAHRFNTAFTTIVSDEADEKATEVLATMNRFPARAETVRVALKAPILAADKAIGSAAKGPFAAVVDPVAKAMATIKAKSIAYKQDKEAERRKALEDEAERARVAAQAAEKAARRGTGTISYADAAAAAEKAEEAQRLASTSTANLTRSRGSDVGTSSLVRKRLFQITEPHLVPRQLCVPSEQLVRAVLGKVGEPIPNIPGVRIYDEDSLTVRG